MAGGRKRRRKARLVASEVDIVGFASAHSRGRTGYSDYASSFGGELRQ